MLCVYVLCVVCSVNVSKLTLDKMGAGMLIVSEITHMEGGPSKEGR